MNAETDSLVRYLDGTQFVTEGAPRPDNITDAEDVLASLHPLMATAEGMHDDIVGCFGLIDEAGRCKDCGRLVVVGMWRAHKEGGCLMAIPFVGTAVWLVQHRDGIPLVGQLIWRYRRRKSPTVEVAGSAATSPSTVGPSLSGRLAARPGTDPVDGAPRPPRGAP